MDHEPAPYPAYGLEWQGEPESQEEVHWSKKFPCRTCTAGYTECMAGAVHSLMCCSSCSHPDPSWTPEEIADMNKGKLRP